MVRHSYCTILFLAVLTTAAVAQAQTDPGPRPGPPTAGRPFPNLNANELAYFNEGASRFRSLDSVMGTQPGAADSGLGPRFNLNSCAGCHAQPSPGGSSPQVNPQIAVATNFGATNAIPSFIQQNGPVRVVRFKTNPDGTPDGGVHDLFVITGRSDAAGCSIAQPDFATAVAQNNASFRIPVPLFGAGLIESISDTAILSNLAANNQQKTQLGINGQVNRSANDGTITRYGWKAQNKSLLMFAGEAYNVEQGVTNELFPTERDETPGCVFNRTPEDSIDLTATTSIASMSDIAAFEQFMRYLAPPAPPQPPQGQAGQSAQHGSQVFAQIGCALCHTPTLPTGNAASAALANQQVQLFSDLAIHNMGSGLDDGITQGLAQGTQWRTAPLWGLGQRIFFLHDGRASDLTQAIAAHASQGSEATQVVNNYNALPGQSKQDLLNFLRSL
jgi:CxxC motif-containing protein (DUF1111 family)